MLHPSTKSIDQTSGDDIGSRIDRAASSVSLETQWLLLTISLLIVDFLMIGLAFFIAYQLRFGLGISFFREDANSSYAYYQALAFGIVPIWIVIFALYGLYRRNTLLGGAKEYALVFRATSSGILAVLIGSFFVPDFILARGWLVAAWVLAFLLVSASRLIIRRLVYAIRRHGYFLTPAVIIGANQEGKALAEQLSSWQTSGLHLIGFVDDGLRVGAKVQNNLNCLGSIKNLDQLIKKNNIGELILSNSALSREELMSLFTHYGFLDHVNLRLSSGLFEIITTGMDVKEFAYVPLVRIRRTRLSGADQLLKLMLDYSITILGLVFIAPLLLIISLAVKLESPGPVIHRRRVMGINSREFSAYKFRSMYVNGDEILDEYPRLRQKLNEDQKLKNDPRITGMGRILRKTSLDELPQLINVLTREMSLVGPRIISPGEMAKYGDWGLNLLTTQPGITGLWQVSGRSDLSYDERVRLDMYYIRNWNIWFDLQILWQTIPAVIKGRGAY